MTTKFTTDVFAGGVQVVCENQNRQAQYEAEKKYRQQLASERTHARTVIRNFARVNMDIDPTLQTVFRQSTTTEN